MIERTDRRRHDPRSLGWHPVAHPHRRLQDAHLLERERLRLVRRSARIDEVEPDVAPWIVRVDVAARFGERIDRLAVVAAAVDADRCVVRVVRVEARRDVWIGVAEVVVVVFGRVDAGVVPPAFLVPPRRVGECPFGVVVRQPGDGLVVVEVDDARIPAVGDCPSQPGGLVARQWTETGRRQSLRCGRRLWCSRCDAPDGVVMGRRCHDVVGRGRRSGRAGSGAEPDEGERHRGRRHGDASKDDRGSGDSRHRVCSFERGTPFVPSPPNVRHRSTRAHHIASVCPGVCLAVVAIGISAGPDGEPAVRCVPMSAPVRIVLAEDNAFLREGLSRLLAASGRVEILAACGSLDELLEAVEAEEPDVVLTDIRMPPTHTDEGVRGGESVAAHPSTRRCARPVPVSRTGTGALVAE